MRFPQFSWLLLVLLYSVSVLFATDQVLLVCGQCLEDQRDLLLQLNQSLSFSPGYTINLDLKLASWNKSTDCCDWKGVTCDVVSGHVTGLDLSSESISSGIDNSSSSLFSLRDLQSLNLTNNSFNSSPIPSGLVKLVNLTNLNLSNAGFGSQVPIEISRLTRLVSLDLSTLLRPELSRLEIPDLETLVQNLSGLRILRLDGVNISASGSQWGEVLSSALPNLQVLRLSDCCLSGPLDSSLSKLKLRILDLSNNQIHGEIYTWVWTIGDESLMFLNLSFNLLTKYLIDQNQGWQWALESGLLWAR